MRSSACCLDFATKTITGSVDAYYNDGWYGPGPIERGVIEPTPIAADGSFHVRLAVEGAPRQGDLHGRLMGSAADEIALYWDNPARLPGFGWLELREAYSCPACTTCTP